MLCPCNSECNILFLLFIAAKGELIVPPPPHSHTNEQFRSLSTFSFFVVGTFGTEKCFRGKSLLTICAFHCAFHCAGFSLNRCLGMKVWGSCSVAASLFLGRGFLQYFLTVTVKSWFLSELHCSEIKRQTCTLCKRCSVIMFCYFFILLFFIYDCLVYQKQFY